MTARKDPDTPKRKQPNLPPKIKLGRPTVYTQELDEHARRLCLLGLTDDELAEYFGITRHGISRWDKLHPSFLSARAEGREKADAQVADSLHKRAMGYTHRAVKIMVVDKTVVREEYIEHYPPDTNAAALWLANRQRGRWKLKPTEDDTRDEDGGRSIRIYGGLPDD
jgi:hypothetical protein